MAQPLLVDKVQKAHIFDCDNLTNFVSVITKILPFGGASMSRLYECSLYNITFLTKVSFYSKSPPEIYNSTTKKPHPDAEMLILAKLREEFLNTGATPCIVDLVYSHKCTNVLLLSKTLCNIEKHNVINIIPSEDMISYLCEFSNMVREGIAHDAMSFLILERCDFTIDEFLRRHGGLPISVHILKSILFQIILTLAMIVEVYPQFKHNDIHSDNVMLKVDPNYVFDPSKPAYIIYKHNKNTYYVPYFGLIPKLIDFGHAALPEENIYSAATDDKKQMYNRAGLDILFLLYTMHKTLSMSVKNIAMYEELFNEIDPSNLYLDYNTTKIRASKETYKAYTDILPKFSEYKTFAPNFKKYGKFTDKHLRRK